MGNERITENIVRSLLREKGYYDNDNIVVEEQASNNKRIINLLKNASKTGKGIGRPEFIISLKDRPDDIIIVECKAKTSQHESETGDRQGDYAVDGVLHYAKHLKEEFNTTAIAISGESDREKKISSFLWFKKALHYKNIQDKIFLKPKEIENILTEQSKPITEEDLTKKAIEYNNLLDSYSIPETERCTLISAVLVSLQDEPFLKSYKYYKLNQELIEGLLKACENVLKKRILKTNSDNKKPITDDYRVNIIISEYSKFKTNSDFNSELLDDKKKKQKKEKNTILRDFIQDINNDILPYINDRQFDVLGKFYTEFIRYAGSDKKTGLVLTPSHITDLFCDLSDLSVNDIVFDPCCGTAGFLVSAMKYMIEKAGNDTDKIKNIKENQLLGIEKRPDMFSHACSNMMIRGDGKSHIYQGSCFDSDKKEIIKSHKPTKGFLNPPYKDGNADEQLEFIENTLECLQKDGVCVAICQMSTVVSDSKSVIDVKERLLNKHTLEAVLSMPIDLFHPQCGVPTCILVFKAHNPHKQNKKTFFGYFRNDGYVKTKNNGRIDKNKTWNQIKQSWLNCFENKDSLVEFSIIKNIKATDEWCAEAYIETNYSQIKNDLFISTIHNYISFSFAKGLIKKATGEPFCDKKISLYSKNWEYFKLYPILFDVKGGKYYAKDSYSTGGTPLVSCSENMNGIMSFTDLEPKYNEQALTIGKVGISTYYQNIPFTVTSDVSVLLPKFKMNPFIALFISTVLNKEKFKWSYGRQIRQNDCKRLSIKLPVDEQGQPDWKFMENYIKSLPYSSNL